MLTYAAYESLGGVEGALAGYAERVYRERLSGPEGAAAQRVLTQLVMPGEATEHTRRVARRNKAAHRAAARPATRARRARVGPAADR